MKACAARVYDDANNTDARREIGRGPTMSQRYPRRLSHRQLCTWGRGDVRNGQIHSYFAGNENGIDSELCKAHVCLKDGGIKRVEEDRSRCEADDSVSATRAGGWGYQFKREQASAMLRRRDLRRWNDGECNNEASGLERIPKSILTSTHNQPGDGAMAAPGK